MEQELLKACEKGDLDRVRQLLSQGCSPMVANDGNGTPLHLACRYVPSIVNHRLERLRKARYSSTSTLLSMMALAGSCDCDITALPGVLITSYWHYHKH